MKTKLLVVVGSLFITACGSDKLSDAGRGPASVTDDGVHYDQNFNADVSLQQVGSISFSPRTNDMKFGCSESAREFVVYMKAADEQFKVTFRNVQITESKSNYTSADLVNVELAGQLLGQAFDPAKQQQHQLCQAHLERRNDVLSGTIECDGVTALGSSDLGRLTISIGQCDIAQR